MGFPLRGGVGGAGGEAVGLLAVAGTDDNPHTTDDWTEGPQTTISLQADGSIRSFTTGSGSTDYSPSTWNKSTTRKERVVYARIYGTTGGREVGVGPALADVENFLAAYYNPNATTFGILEVVGDASQGSTSGAGDTHPEDWYIPIWLKQVADDPDGLTVTAKSLYSNAEYSRSADVVGQEAPVGIFVEDQYNVQVMEIYELSSFILEVAGGGQENMNACLLDADDQVLWFGALDANGEISIDYYAEEIRLEQVKAFSIRNSLMTAELWKFTPTGSENPFGEVGVFPGTTITVPTLAAEPAQPGATFGLNVTDSGLLERFQADDPTYAFDAADWTGDSRISSIVVDAGGWLEIDVIGAFTATYWGAEFSAGTDRSKRMVFADYLTEDFSEQVCGPCGLAVAADRDYHGALTRHSGGTAAFYLLSVNGGSHAGNTNDPAPAFSNFVRVRTACFVDDDEIAGAILPAYSGLEKLNDQVLSDTETIASQTVTPPAKAGMSGNSQPGTRESRWYQYWEFKDRVLTITSSSLLSNGDLVHLHRANGTHIIDPVAVSGGVATLDLIGVDPNEIEGGSLIVTNSTGLVLKAQLDQVDDAFWQGATLDEVPLAWLVDDLEFDLNADSLTGLSDGDTVATWTDDFAALDADNYTGGGGKNPRYRPTGLNGGPAVDLATDAGAGLEIIDALMGTIGEAPHTLFILCRPDASFIANRTLTSFLDAGAPTNYVTIRTNGDPDYVVETSPAPNGGTGNLVGTDPVVLDYAWEGPTNNIDLFEDDVEVVAPKVVNGAPSGVDRFRIGTANIHVTRILAYSRVLSSTEREFIRAILMARGGIS